MAVTVDQIIRWYALQTYRHLPPSVKQWMSYEDCIQEGYMAVLSLGKGPHDTALVRRSVRCQMLDIQERHRRNKRDGVSIDIEDVAYSLSTRPEQLIVDFKLHLVGLYKTAPKDVRRIIDFVMSSNCSRSSNYTKGANKGFRWCDIVIETGMSLSRVHTAVDYLKRHVKKSA